MKLIESETSQSLLELAILEDGIDNLARLFGENTLAVPCVNRPFALIRGSISVGHFPLTMCFTLLHLSFVLAAIGPLLCYMSIPCLSIGNLGRRFFEVQVIELLKGVQLFEQMALH